MNLREIAKKAGVSSATVSYVINGRHNKVSQETIAKVQKIIAENNYELNATARSLASRKSKIIGVVVPNISEEANFFINPYDAHVLALLEQYIRKKGYFMMIRCVVQCKDAIALLSSWNADGIIFFGTFRDEIAEIQRSLTVPAVFIDAYADDLDIVSVGIDDYKGGYLAAQYLLDKGHRSIAIVGPGAYYPGVIRERYDGFCAACEQRNVLIPDDHLFLSNTLYQSGVAAGQEIAASEKNFTAVWVMSDIVAFGVMDGLRLCGKAVPEDISVMGFDNLPECSYSHPKLTTIAQNIEEKALRAGDALFKMLSDEEVTVRSDKIDVELIERQSVIQNPEN